jgi:hypothetical protein
MPAAKHDPKDCVVCRVHGNHDEPDAENKAQRIESLRDGLRDIIEAGDPVAARKIAAASLKRDDALRLHKLSKSRLMEAITRNLTVQGLQVTDMTYQQIFEDLGFTHDE